MDKVKISRDIDSVEDNLVPSTAPSRLSCIRGDAGYKSDSVLARYEVLFMGQSMKNCVVADAEKGYVRTRDVLRHKVTGKPKVVISPRKFGKVEIKEKEKDVQ